MTTNTTTQPWAATQGQRATDNVAFLASADLLESCLLFSHLNAAPVPNQHNNVYQCTAKLCGRIQANGGQEPPLGI